mmetsp:Transcript_34915/g.48597  ORF Transcript_34915/g.48597 Transcript_34915/m.48597 type:complete len:99 (+) Transcript_34915:914-1210(+)
MLSVVLRLSNYHHHHYHHHRCPCNCEGTTKGLRSWETTTGSLLQTSSWDKSSSSSNTSSGGAIGAVPTTLACWNPRALMFASSFDRKLLFWLPKILPN